MLPRAQTVAHGANLGVGQLPRRHQLLPGRIRVAPIQLAAQHRLLRRIGIEHVMEREVLHVFPGHLRHARRPTAVAPRDQLNRGIGRTHGLCKLDGLARRGFEIEAVLVVGRLVPDLPVPDVPAAPRARAPSARRLSGSLQYATHSAASLRVGRAHAVLDLHVLLAAVRLEVDADQRLRASAPAEFDEFAGAHLVRFDAAPQQVQHGGTRAARSDAFPPSIEIRKDAAPPHHRRRELACDLHDILAPLIAHMIPGRFDGTIGRAQRFHELHVEIRRQLEQRLRIHQDGAAVLPLRFQRCRRGDPKRSGGGDTGRRHRRFFEECSSFHSTQVASWNSHLTGVNLRNWVHCRNLGCLAFRM